MSFLLGILCYRNCLTFDAIGLTSSVCGSACLAGIPLRHEESPKTCLVVRFRSQSSILRVRISATMETTAPCRVFCSASTKRVESAISSEVMSILWLTSSRCGNSAAMPILGPRVTDALRFRFRSSSGTTLDKRSTHQGATLTGADKLFARDGVDEFQQATVEVRVAFFVGWL